MDYKLKEILQDILDSDLLEKYHIARNEFSRNYKGIHGRKHSQKVLIFSEILQRLKNIDNDNIRYAAAYHDLKRKSDGKDKEHGLRSALYFRAKFVKKLNQDDIDDIKYLITNHDIEDSEIKDMTLGLKILKDADCLDRWRLGGFDYRYLRLSESHGLINFAKELNSLSVYNDVEEVLEIIINNDILKIYQNELSKRQGRLDFMLNEQKDYYGYLMFKNGQEDLQRFIEYQNYLPDSLYFQQLRKLLSSSYTFGIKKTISKLLTLRSNTHYMMYKNEYRKYKLLPKNVKVYRGCNKDNQDGFSWSLSKKEAKGYSDMNYPGTGIVLSGIVNKEDVICLFLDKGKKEILCLPESVELFRGVER